ncbi:protein FAM166B [Notolabrus celidotus]|uniref:protein FAM166B n=1 Tax=Notolabrus celidotus TaxID=1203425 RepID=UPI00148FBC5A|nr:protein FAM166B [Notolabrus celidotus]
MVATSKHGALSVDLPVASNRVNMKKYAPKLSSVLTPDPGHIPGYTGYCPQLNMGKSYGRLTSKLISRPDTEPSVPSAHYDTALELKMIPGYTGFVPKCQNYFGTNYSDTRRKAMSEFKQERHAWMHRRSSDLPAIANYTNQQSERQRPPLTAISDKVFSYKPVKPFAPPVTPYVMDDDDDPHKHFISGFAGHVPKSRFLFGQGYPITTNQALIQFGGRKDSSSAMPTIYPSDRGLVPFYTGHIPGYQFLYGQTFSQLSQNALEKSGIRRIPQDKSFKQK